MNGRSPLTSLFGCMTKVSTSLLFAGTLTAAAFPVLAEEDNAGAEPITFAPSSSNPVGTQLILAMDTSISMTDPELGIALSATAAALNSKQFRNVIKYRSSLNPGENSLALALIEFDGNAQVRIPWVDIRGDQINDKPYKDCDSLQSQPERFQCRKESSAFPDKLDQLSNTVQNLPRLSQGSTSIHRAMDLSFELFLSCPWKVTSMRVLDIFGDGDSEIWMMKKSQARLRGLGVTVNGFAIENENRFLRGFFEKNVVTQGYAEGLGGIYSQPGRVWAVARNMQDSDNGDDVIKPFFAEVTRGMTQKLSIEFAGVTEYERMLARLDIEPGFPIPKPVAPSY